MQSMLGFIVDVRTKDDTPISYRYGEEPRMLRPDEEFVGYFWQMTDRQEDGEFKNAHIRETVLVDSEKRLFRYGSEAVFCTDDVSISLRALRGPESNNQFLSEQFLKYETWNAI